MAVLFACAVLLPLLGHRPLTDWDEGIYAEVAREMLGAGWRGLLVPHWNGHLWFEKPPLLFWLDVVSLRLFGLNAFAARLPSALAGVATVGLLHGWIQRRFGAVAAWLSTLLLLSAFGFQHVARAGETDALLSLGCLVALIGLAEVDLGRLGGWWLFWSGFAFALMTKGAGSIALPIAAVPSVCLRGGTRRFGRAFWGGALLFFAAVLPWHVYLYARFGRDFLREYLGFHVLGRATAQIEGHITHPWFYLWVLLVSAPPFALVYPWAIAGPFRHSELRPLRAFAVFVLMEFLVFSAVQTRLPHYIAPIYPAASALTGALGARWVSRWRPLRPGAAAMLGLVALLVYGIASAVTAGPRRALHSAHMANGLLNPDNRESVGLLEQSRRAAAGVPGPLLVWRRGAVVPVQTDAFYARRLAQQVSVAVVPLSIPRDVYYFWPEPLSATIKPGESRLLLLDQSLVAELPGAYAFTPMATGPTEVVGLLLRKPEGRIP